MRAEFRHTYRFAGDQIVRFDQVADTWPMVEAARFRISAAEEFQKPDKLSFPRFKYE